MHTPLIPSSVFDAVVGAPTDPELDRLYDALYPAFKSGMGDTLVREVAEDQADSDELWRRAVALQMVLDRIAGAR